VKTQVYGADATLRWRPLSRAIYRSLTLRTELIWSRRAEPAQIRRAFGFYASADYQFARRWTAGLRYDRSERANDPDVTDKGTSLVLTFRPSEFSQVRAQYRRTQLGGIPAADELLFQLLFTLGAHGAHPF
jgi:outer membrane receptor protein involved in Fe transport